MDDIQANKLQGLCVLVVEDEYMVAADLAQSLNALGVDVLGPAGSVRDALKLVKDNEKRLDWAVLDINLANERVYPVADALLSIGVPFIFTTGYEALMIPDVYASAPRCEKPVDKALLARLLSSGSTRRSDSPPAEQLSGP